MPSLGDTLREERLLRDATLDGLAHDIGVPRRVLEDLESETLDLEDAQFRAYLRIYARHLGLDAEALLRDIDGAQPAASSGAYTEPPDRVSEEGPPPVAPLGDHGDTLPPPRPEQRARARRPAVLLGLAALAATAAAVAVFVWYDGPRVELGAPDPEAPGSPVPTPPAAEGQAEGQEDPDPDTVADLEAVRPPEDTRVQVLHNEADEQVLADLTATLEAMGYQVEYVSVARPVFEVTTIFYVEGWQPEAEALRRRDERFGQVTANVDFTADVDLHVALGRDWASPE